MGWGSIQGDSTNAFNGVKIFAATLMTARARLGDRVTTWLEENPSVEICECVVTQSSDDAYHCLTITIFYYEDLRR